MLLDSKILKSTDGKFYLQLSPQGSKNSRFRNLPISGAEVLILTTQYGVPLFEEARLVCCLGERNAQ